MRRAFIIHPDGHTEVTMLLKKPGLDQHYAWIGTDVIQTISCRHEGKVRTMIIDEEGKIHGKPYNPFASALFHDLHPECRGDPIVGTAVVLDGYRA
jgi:hypothetical protein